ncbi:YjjW family glycine radical enzyme activase [Vibrio sp. IRLE0018]|uniref:YjjW family glycine radical enzyme activase n=1 Tax=Vibrio floridensis TaxID=2908007 RepID=UPI001F007770|nr:YjjW family glycine radical enzyme activase [Vibrio floridensis]MCF8778266.1 YjjW family glycine radical enzyme activase [Vibrio floridensis]
MLAVQFNKKGKVSRVLPFSCVDGPGNRLVIFLQGCNFRCLSCHNPHTIRHCNHCGDCVTACPEGALIKKNNSVVWLEEVCSHCDHCLEVCPYHSNPKIKEWTVSEMVDLIRKQHLFISGVTVSGGEATLQLGFVRELFKAIKNDAQLAHLSCFIDSNGSLATHGWETISPYLDGAMIDLKAWQSETHHWLVGRDNHRVILSIKHLVELGKLHEIRLLHIPGRSDLDSEFVALSAFLATLPSNVKIRLNAFGHHGVKGEATQWPVCTPSELIHFARLLSARLPHVIQLPATSEYQSSISSLS